MSGNKNSATAVATPAHPGGRVLTSHEVTNDERARNLPMVTAAVELNFIGDVGEQVTAMFMLLTCCSQFCALILMVGNQPQKLGYHQASHGCQCFDCCRGNWAES